ncbi:MAG TPA: acyltransferase [Leptolyngbyaceae cyanobacterium M33_DOE_097]|uniref:Acyltransferase n=1 Tax=Oscillatoriales cyanobacterium SpSt-418 TaxID=2282169 RepID=A0A7C3PN98_9CYAN|nr:acyltransferase [Leptolyngbyaceae cyanobacterium M33_DOE_097]
MLNSVNLAYQTIDPPQKPKRIAWVDYAKGFGILLVVIGHTLRGLVSNSILEPTIFEQTIDKWIYAFHMPLFFFISGLFIERSIAQSFSSFLISKLQTIAYPYFLWSFLQEMIRSLSNTSSEPTEKIWRIIYQPTMQFWFLYVLFGISVMYAVFRKSSLSVEAFGFACGLLYITYLLKTNFGSWTVLYMLRINAIYFATGALTAKFNMLDRLNNFRSADLVRGARAGFLFILLGVITNLHEIGLLTPLFAFSGIFSTLSLVTFLQRHNFADFLKRWGFLSLQIFVAHTIFSAGLRTFLEHFNHHASPLMHIVLGTWIGIYGPIGLYMICQKFKFPYLFTWRPIHTAGHS